VGCLLSGILASGRSARDDAPVAESVTAAPSPRRWWQRPERIALAVFWGTAIVAVAFRGPMPGIWAGASFLVSCALLGLVALAAAFGRKTDRAAWLGAALFGFGYLALTFGKSAILIVAPNLPTEGLINTLLRPGGPVSSEFPEFTSGRVNRLRNALVKRKLEMIIPIHFPQEAPLDEVLKHFKKATAEDGFPGLPIYVDPVGLQIAEKSMNSKVTIDVDGLPMRQALSLCLKQLGLGYSVRDGFIMITDADAATIPVYEDPVQVVGHSLLALVAAVVGFYSVLLISGRWRPSLPGRLTAPASIEGEATS
jgi:hypothetical protein